MEQLHCHVKQYAWGKFGEESEVARLFADGHEHFTIDKNAPYAELWMGTHPDGPAQLKKCLTKLSTHLAKNPSPLITNNNSSKNIHLPFIMKIMSIRTTLSLQVHPTKEQAKRLHERDPVHYPDRNHKPELAYALTRFELLCGFRPSNEILDNLKAFPSLRLLFGGEKMVQKLETVIIQNTSQSIKCRQALAACFKYMMMIQNSEVKGLVFKLLEELSNGVRGAVQENTVEVIRKMSIDFPNDIGIFSPLFLNHMILEPGQCCYYAAEELHAYLSGECVECVGCSNNTIRAAMTPKFIDREALCEVLNYKMTEPEDYLVHPTQLTDCVAEFAPDCKDFQLHKINVEIDQQPENSQLPALECASILVITSGSASIEERTQNDEFVSKYDIKRGDIFYIPSKQSIRIVNVIEPIEAYRTFSYEIGPDHESRIITTPSISSAAVEKSQKTSEKVIKLDEIDVAIA
ncbi:unnamed protein product [Caenorhabditis angaria]|uniref:mannose-6-phosphate isomerase n=1 Tax=Caenorhabditis angaria TaxID=860376 RepID=A0A9P1IVV1_9PELO|nr:unnamed protein product [Caenorhabditis angaria]